MTQFTTLPELHTWLFGLLEGTAYDAYEELPTDEARPFYLVAEKTEPATGNLFGSAGATPDFTVRAYSAEDNDVQAQLMVRSAIAAISGQSFSGPGYATGMARYQETTIIQDPQGGRQAVIRFRLQANAA